MSSLLVAVTGNSGCGQSTVASVFGSLGAEVCSLDAVGHRLLSRKYVVTDLAMELSMPELHGRCSEDIRKLLRGEAFSEPGMIEAINRVLHPRMARWCRIATAGVRRGQGVFVLEGALVLEMGLSGLFDVIVVVRDTFQRCSQRLQAVYDLAPEVLRGRWENQLPMDEKARRADFVLDNSGTLEDLGEKAATLYRRLSAL
ncbi:dephospho-CoA kinase [Candidatus Fermentibacteria bacterium]|nr:dephospho-CoA kinase [Candidatus Fermentibacteria bacterium]